MIITARVPEALEHSVSANIIARELFAEFPDDEKFQELYDISQNLLRMVQQQTREERNNASLNQQNLSLADGSTHQSQFGSLDTEMSTPSPYASSFSLPPLFSNPIRRRRHRASDINTNLAAVPELPEDEPPARGPSRPVYRNRRPSSLCLAAGNLVRKMALSQGN